MARLLRISFGLFFIVCSLYEVLVYEYYIGGVVFILVALLLLLWR